MDKYIIQFEQKANIIKVFMRYPSINIVDKLKPRCISATSMHSIYTFVLQETPQNLIWFEDQNLQRVHRWEQLYEP